ncbi:MAG: sugar nucleotide-binding protein, partial [Bacteroidales bacterium]|nr:sugar nucleotide-binding protein [Bacteroidales bacterium]
SKTTPYLPSDKPNPLSVYGKTKYEGEQMALQNCKHCLVIRTSWLYSEYGNNFVKTMLRLGSERKDLGVVFDQTGTPCYARDLAKVVLLCLDKDFEGQILHFSNEGVCSWYDFALKIMQLGKKDCHVRPIRTADYPTPAKRPAYSVLDKADIKQFLGIEIPHWEESLNECLKRL